MQEIWPSDLKSRVRIRSAWSRSGTQWGPLDPHPTVWMLLKSALTLTTRYRSEGLDYPWGRCDENRRAVRSRPHIERSTAHATLFLPTTDCAADITLPRRRVHRSSQLSRSRAPTPKSNDATRSIGDCELKEGRLTSDWGGSGAVHDTRRLRAVKRAPATNCRRTDRFPPKFGPWRTSIVSGDAPFTPSRNTSDAEGARRRRRTFLSRSAHTSTVG
jgi:hypothetical protein